MCEELIIKVLNESLGFISVEQARKLKLVLEKALYDYDLMPKVTTLVPLNNINENIFLFLASKKIEGKADTTLTSYRRYLLRFSGYMQKNIKDITAMDIRIFLATISKENPAIKQNTIATGVSYLRSFFGWLRKEEYIQKDPMDRIETAKPEKRIRKPLTNEELEMVRDACETLRDRAVLEFFYSTGCRLDEVQKLNKSDIQWSDSSVLVFGKGKKERVVYLNAKSKVHLWKYLNSRTDNSDALFVSSKQPFARLGRRSIQILFNDLGKRAGINKRVFPHRIRHTTATNMLNNGANIVEVQEYLGHDDLSMTQIYAQLDKDSIKYSHKKHLA